jgi:hypothetical protein
VERDTQGIADGLDLVEEGFCPGAVFYLVVGASGDPLNCLLVNGLQQGSLGIKFR